MRELVVISGKGGTGKTSVLASLAVLFRKRAVVVDCDVDAADLHLVLAPRVIHSIDFVGGSKAQIKPELCIACGKCVELCRFDAIRRVAAGPDRSEDRYHIDTLACEGCGVCAHFCGADAIDFTPAVNGQWFVSETRCGPMVHARMNVGAENSGRLVTQLRRQAAQVARQHNLDMILCDGSPGIGCPVIASLTGAQMALIVVEPTLSGLHDFQRVAQLTRQLNVAGRLVVNKADLNQQVAATLEREAERLGVPLLGRIPYDPQVTRAQINRRTVVEVSNGPAAQAIGALWRRLDQTAESRVSG